MSGSNMYGYTDYHGPQLPHEAAADATERHDTVEDHESHPDDDDEPHNPLQVGFWMDGDSLAPPCGSSISTIHALLEFAQVNRDDVLYDLGCGDGRVCLEAFVQYGCRTVGVEVEDDLVDRANVLILNLAKKLSSDEPHERLPRVVQYDLRQVLKALVAKAKRVYKSEHAGDEPVEDDISSSLADLPIPTVIVMYLLPEAIEMIKTDLIQLLEILPDKFRILCNTWGIKGLTKASTMEVKEESLALTPLLLYTKASLEPPK